ncbi:MAG TPA: carboxypeptidase-like regulatory domain-containing protein [Bacteroidales bacterium]|nr:carboxypeptidase-like regulatory domain-containing protein [Bacteroidales bacterium]HPF03031.1 carboxypeptidase-like regulatory domain-containing protein [Bacteroidales bacterium]HPJ59841.1 carboxypeptidase-like regulatory domain-containing protein [Bacteroidales bacterium]HPR12711.1 carboxypeptidase-like regulatory domain-containing protein [Bacteroidales bacterium]HRW85581.1 carboxypeptidase-like regulatory domain-containing protein [Bacteroidales bacterium]
MNSIKKHLLILPLLVVCSCSLFSQGSGTTGKMLLFHGLIRDAETNAAIGGSQIFINRIFSGVSDEEGRFAFYVNRRDTVIFRSLGYKPATIQVDDSLSGKEFIAGVFMHTDTLGIQQVVIMPRIASLRSDLLRPQISSDKKLDNAKFNLAVSAYQGRVVQGELGDPAMNYEIIRQQQKNDAYSKGQIPSDKLVGLSPLLLIPAAYLLINGIPEKPVMVIPVISDSEADMIYRKYLELLKEK